MAQAQHGSAPDIAGRNMANPMSLLLSVAMLLDDGENLKRLAVSKQKYQIYWHPLWLDSGFGWYTKLFCLH